MFGYAQNNHPDFKFFISMDLWAAGDTEPPQSVIDFVSLLKSYIDHPSYQRGPEPERYPMVSTFADGGLQNYEWQAWRDAFDNHVFLIPDFDHTEGYWESDPGWWWYWGNIVDGLFSWESAWPYRAGYGGAYAGDITPDVKVLEGATNHSRPYMIRNHYIGNLWREQNNDTDPSRYAVQKYQPHDGWRPILGSFIQAFKNGKKAADMQPFGGDEFTGALWYKTILQEASCPWDGAGEYFVEPDGFSSGTDTLNFAVIMPSRGYFIELYSNGRQIIRAELGKGFNYGTVPGVQAGFQKMVIKDTAGNIKQVATGGPCVSDGCPDCIYNMNPVVVPFSDKADENSGLCPETRCGGADVYVPDSVWTDPDPIVQCIPPCTFILPPLRLSTATTISWPRLTTTVYIKTNDETLTKTTIISIPPITTTEIPFWPVTVKATDLPEGTIKATQRLYPPGFTTVWPGSIATFKPTLSSGEVPPPTFVSDSYTQIIQPQPTVDISLPPVPSITYTSHKPRVTCTANCGVNDCERFGCPGDDDDGESDDKTDSGGGRSKPRCGIFSCHGGCGIFGCDGGCGLGGCSAHCSLRDCGGLSCVTGTCGGLDDDSEGSEPGGDGDICDGDTCCNPELDLDIGRCSNGNFPVYDIITSTINCGYTDEEALDMMSSCQEEALENIDVDADLLEAAHSCACVPGLSSGTSKRSSSCPQNAPPPAVTPAPSPQTCETTWTCDFSTTYTFGRDVGSIPQICANAKSAIDLRGEPSILTIGSNPENDHDTNDWYKRKFGTDNPGYWRIQIVGHGAPPRTGWGLNLCNVEEYPFSSGRDSSNRHPTL
ncbi:Glycoside hydrolase family 71, partial [Macrophomina phaseolina MS6]